MLEGIICKLLNYLGDYCGIDYDDLYYTVRLTTQEVDECKEIIEEAKPL